MRVAVNAGLFGIDSATTIQHLPAEKLRVTRYPAPPFAKQCAIADFLDTETARIDELIAAKENLFAILAEKRRALVAQAVTRGLDPNVKMRDSGVPWLGEIPAHWKVVPFRFLVDMASGATPSTGEPLFWDGDIPWVSPKDMKRIEIADAQDHVTPLALSSTTLNLIGPPVVLIVVRGMILGHTFPVAITTAPITINQDMKALRPRGGLSALFLRDFLRGIDTHILSIVGESAHGTRKLETELALRYLRQSRRLTRVSPSKGLIHEPPKGGYFLRHCSFSCSSRSSSSSCCRMYSRTTASSSPTVDTKYPRAQKCPATIISPQ